MNQSHFRKLRVIAAGVLFSLATALFLGLDRLIPGAAREAVLSLQFIPSLLNFASAASLAAAGFIVVLLLTLLCGRVYCSTLCPLGVLQDIAIHLAGRFRPGRTKFVYARPHTALRYGVLILTLATLLSGSLLTVTLLDPFSGFGRIIADLVRPLYLSVHNLAADALTLFDIYLLKPVEWQAPSPVALAAALLLLAVILGLSVRKGRLYCNTVCPVGTLLGFVARFALFRIRIDQDACTVCANCSIACKAGCIRLKTATVDFSRCVGCGDCLAVCPALGIRYRLSAPWRGDPAAVADASKRAFLGKTFGYLAGAASLAPLGWVWKQGREANAAVAGPPAPPVSPPGSQSIARFNQTCTACHLCVSACPTQVLQPAFLEYGLSGLLQPRMDYHRSFCNYDCTLCGELCPTGAILPLPKAVKQTTQLGVARFLKEICIVYTDHTACGACDEHCPTKAVRLVPYQGSLTIPAVDETLCIGCGACEYACPVRPRRAIYVAGSPWHAVARKPDATPLTVEVKEDFPF